MKVLLLRFDAPLMAFGTTLTDQRGVTGVHPGLSMVTGLIGNALGFDHADKQALQRLQQRLRMAVREDLPATHLQDYQTVDLGQSFMSGSWTTRGSRAIRKGGAASTGTHIRYRDYLADAEYTIAVCLEPKDVAPTLNQVEEALNSPERPLFFGRKPCLPSQPISRGRVDAASLLEALEGAPLSARARDRPPPAGKLRAWASAELVANELMEFPVYDLRDWANQVHTGRRLLRETYLDPPKETAQ